MSLPRHLSSLVSTAIAQTNNDRLFPIVGEFRAKLPKATFKIVGNYKTGFALEWDLKEGFGPNCSEYVISLIRAELAIGADKYGCDKVGKLPETLHDTWIWKTERQIFNMVNRFFAKKMAFDISSDWQDRRPMVLAPMEDLTKKKKKTF